MRNSEKVLIFISFINGIMISWLSVWWTKIFSTSISNSVWSMNSIIESILGVFYVFLIIKKFENPEPYIVLMASLSVFASLFGLVISPEVFLLVSTVLGSFSVSFNRILHTSLVAQNVLPGKRNMFDNREYLFHAVGGVIGGAIALFTISEKFAVSYWIIWTGVFLLDSVCTLVKILLINNGTFVYSKGFNSIVDEE